MTAHTADDDPRDGWRQNAACLDHPAEWFTGPNAPGDTRRAIDVCTTCPVKQPCLEAALSIESSADLGIWGGTTPATRRRLRQEQACGRVSRRIPPQSFPQLSPRPSPERNPLATSDELQLVEDDNGDFVDRSGRVMVFEIHGDPRYMLMIDDRPRARTTTVKDAAGLAARFLARDSRALRDRVAAAISTEFGRRRS